MTRVDEKNPALKKTYTEKFDAYETRAKQIKEHLKKEQEAKDEMNNNSGGNLLSCRRPVRNCPLVDRG